MGVGNSERLDWLNELVWFGVKGEGECKDGVVW
jgi:hypothetical protein